MNINPNRPEPEIGEDVYRVHTTGPRGWLRRWHLELHHDRLDQGVAEAEPASGPVARVTRRRPEDALAAVALAAVDRHFTTAPSYVLVLQVGDLRLSDESVYALALGTLRLTPEPIR